MVSLEFPRVFSSEISVVSSLYVSKSKRISFKRNFLSLPDTCAQMMTTSSACAVSITELSLNCGSFASKNVLEIILGGRHRRSPLITLFSPFAVRPCARNDVKISGSTIGLYCDCLVFVVSSSDDSAVVCARRSSPVELIFTTVLKRLVF